MGAAQSGGAAGRDGRPVHRGRLGRRLLWGGGALVLLLVVLVALAPTIANAIAPSYVESAAAKAITGSVSVTGMHLSWGGPQAIGPVVLKDDAGAKVGEVQVRMTRGLLDLLLDQKDLGTLTLSGEIDVVRGPDGRTNLERATASRTPAPPAGGSGGGSGGGGLPPGYTGVFELTGLTIRYTELDQAGATVRAASVSNMRGAAQFTSGTDAGGAAAEMTVTGELRSGDPNKPVGPGSLNVHMAAKDFTGPNGVIAPERATVNASMTAGGLPVGLLDALAQMNGALMAAVGPTATIIAEASGTMADATAKVLVQSPGADVDLAVRSQGGRVVAERPGRVVLQSGQFLRKFPAVESALTQLAGTVSLDELPGVQVSVDKLNVPLPARGGALDLRGTGVEVRARLGGVSGTVALGPAGPGGAPPAMQPFSTEPVEMVLATEDLATGARLEAGTRATVAGEPGGAVRVEASARGLLDERGAPRAGVPADFTGSVLVTGLSTALAQPFLASANAPLDLRTDVGPVLDLELRAKPSQQANAQAGGVPRTDVDLLVTSSNMNAAAALTVDATEVRTRGDRSFVRMASAKGLINRVLERQGEQRLRVDGESAVIAAVEGLVVPLRDGAPALGQTSGKVSAGIGGFQVFAGNGPSGPLYAHSAGVDLLMTPGQPASVAIDSKLAHGGAGFGVTGSLAAPGLMEMVTGAGGGPAPLPGLGAIRATGTIEAKGVPASVLELADAFRAPSPEGAPASLAGLVRDVLGAGVDVRVDLDGASGASQKVALAAGAPNLKARTGAELTATEIAVTGVDAEASVSPGGLESLLRFAGQDALLRDGLRLRQPGTIVAKVEPLRVPLAPGGSLTPDFAKATGELAARVDVRGALLVEGLQVNGAPTAAGVRDFTAQLRAPLRAASAAPPADAMVDATLFGEVLSGDGPAAARLEGQVKASGDANVVDAQVGLVDVRTAELDRLLNKPGYVSGAIGESARVTATAKKSAGQPMRAVAAIEAPRLKATGLSAQVSDDRYALAGPAEIEWRMDGAWATANLLGGAGNPDAVRLAGEVPVRLTVERAVIAKAAEANGQQVAGPMKPGVFDLRAALAVGTMDMGWGAGPQAQSVRVEGVTAALASGQQPGSLTLDAKVARVTGAGGAASGEGPMGVTGTVTNLADARGVVTAGAAAVTMNALLRAFPTAIVDAAANQGGLMIELLGPTVDLEARAENLSATGGTLRASASSQRANARMAGAIQGGAFVASEPVQANLVEIRPELSKMLVRGIPLVASIEKRPDDKPASVTATSLTAPIDGDMRKLNGTIVADFGLARFQTNDLFGKLLKAAGTRDAGVVGRRVEPFTVQAREGVLRYERFRLPIGEFTLETQGSVDLVQNTIDVITYVPLLALSDETLNVFGGSLQGLFGRALPEGVDRMTLVPIRTRGPLGQARSEVDAQLFFQEQGKNLIQTPGKAVENIFKGVEDILKKDKK